MARRLIRWHRWRRLDVPLSGQYQTAARGDRYAVLDRAPWGWVVTVYRYDALHGEHLELLVEQVYQSRRRARRWAERRMRGC